MKRALVIAVVILLAIALYLDLAYAHIYSTIHAGNLSAPMTTVVEAGSPLIMALPPLRYVALGDSLTAGVGAVSVSETFPYQLAEAIAKKQGRIVQLINLGVPGARAEDVLKEQVPELLRRQPDIVTLVVGVNDIHYGGNLTDFEKNIAAILATLKPTKAKVLVATVPLVGDRTILWPPYQTYFKWQTTRYARALQETAAGQDVTLVDLFGLTSGPEWRETTYYSRDHFHLNAFGYKLWADFFYDSITW